MAQVIRITNELQKLPVKNIRHVGDEGARSGTVILPDEQEIPVYNHPENGTIWYEQMSLDEWRASQVEKNAPDNVALSQAVEVPAPAKERELLMNQPIKQPPLPPEERLAAMTAAMVEARCAKLDLGEILAAALHTAAETLGDVEALVAGRPGSWEADIIRRMASEPVGGGRWTKEYASSIQKLAPLFVQMGQAGEDGGDVLSQAMGPAVDELGGLIEFASNSDWFHDLVNIGRQYSSHCDDNIY